MAAVANAAAGVLAALDAELRERADAFGPGSAAAVRVALLDAVGAETARAEARAGALRGHVERLLLGGGGDGSGDSSNGSGGRPPLAVLTASYSSTLLAAMRAAAPRLGRVYVCEARPLCEGVAFARALAAAGADVAVITDAQAGVFVPKCDLVLLGADALTPAGAVNKVGSRLLALAARDAGVPAYACGDSGKLSPGVSLAQLVSISGGGHNDGEAEQQQEQEEEKGADEVVAGWPQHLRLPDAACVDAAAVAAEAAGGAAGGAARDSGEQQQQQQQQQQPPKQQQEPPDAPCRADAVAVRNVYFEAVPYALLAGVVTEDGVVAPAAIRAAAEARRDAWLAAFDLHTLHHPPPDEEPEAAAAAAGAGATASGDEEWKGDDV